MTTGPTPGRGAAATELLGVLYPPPLRVARGAAPEQARAGWTAIPTATSPRLLVADSAPRAAARVVRRQLTGRRPRTRAARAALGLAMATGLPSRAARLRMTVQGPGTAASIEDPLREVLGPLLPAGRVPVSLPIGPARANRKPVLQVTDAAGAPVAFVKVGHNPLTGRLVRGEAAALRAVVGLAAADVRPPRVLGHLTWRGLEVLVLEPLTVPSARLTGRAARTRLEQLVAAVAAGGAGPTVAWQRHPHRDRLLAGPADGPSAADLRERLSRLPGQVDVGVAGWHGDLNSGNFALVAGPCPVWDWERYERDVPLGFDLLHHDLHEAITVGGQEPRAAAGDLLAGAPEVLAPLGIPADAARLTAHAYLLTLAARYLADDQQGAGADLGRVHEWLLPALDAHPLPTGAGR